MGGSKGFSKTRGKRGKISRANKHKSNGTELKIQRKGSINKKTRGVVTKSSHGKKGNGIEWGEKTSHLKR